MMVKISAEVSPELSRSIERIIRDGWFPDQETVIRTASDKARLVTPQSATSYTWMLVDGVMELHITNPAEFRKVREVVIMTS